MVVSSLFSNGLSHGTLFLFTQVMWTFPRIWQLPHQCLLFLLQYLHRIQDLCTNRYIGVF